MNEMKQDSVNILRDLKAILSYHNEAGIERYPSGEELELFFNADWPAAKVSRSNHSPEVHPALKNTSPVGAGRQKVAKKEIELPDSTLLDIREEVDSCTSCSLSAARSLPVAGEGREGADLLVVGDWLVWEKGKPAVSGCVFGIEQDRMLGKMMEAIGYPMEKVFVSNVIKCGIPENCQPKAEHAKACTSYLYRQIARLKPTIVLAMGMIATRTLLQRREPLSRLRGRLHMCMMPDGSKIPLIATYHPTFLLQNPEMKKATWYDLQMLAKYLRPG